MDYNQKLFVLKHKMSPVVSRSLILQSWYFKSPCLHCWLSFTELFLIKPLSRLKDKSLNALSVLAVYQFKCFTSCVCQHIIRKSRQPISCLWSLLIRISICIVLHKKIMQSHWVLGLCLCLISFLHSLKKPEKVMSQWKISDKSNTGWLATFTCNQATIPLHLQLYEYILDPPPDIYIDFLK